MGSRSKLPDSIIEMSATQLSRAIAARVVSCREVMTAYLDQIETYNGVYNAIVALVDRDVLMEQAAAADRELDNGEHRGWMHGMPQAPKDLSNCAEFPTTSGFRGFVDNVAKSDALFVQRIRDAGAIFIGKTNTPEFGLGSQTYNGVYGITRNAWDPILCAGGSSGGRAGDAHAARCRWQRHDGFAEKPWRLQRGTLAVTPMVNVPVGFGSDGRPMGLQIIGPPGEDMRTLRFADTYTFLTDYLDQSPKLRESLA